MRLIVATKNQGKLKEIKKILKGLKLEIVSLADVAPAIRIKEDGTTFLENALKKTKAVSRRFPDDLVVGEDSGLEVAALDGRPGIYSSRFSGKNATDSRNNRKLMRLMEGVPRSKRRACYCCVMVLMKGDTVLTTCRGRFCGLIHHEMIGENGFGYDPLMYIPRYKKTVAQIPLSVKNKISHRAQAFLRLNKFLVTYFKKQ